MHTQTHTHTSIALLMGMIVDVTSCVIIITIRCFNLSYPAGPLNFACACPEIMQFVNCDAGMLYNGDISLPMKWPCKSASDTGMPQNYNINKQYNHYRIMFYFCGSKFSRINAKRILLNKFHAFVLPLQATPTNCMSCVCVRACTRN